MTIDDILGSFLHSVEICEQSSEDQEKFLDKILASQEPSEPDCLRQLQLFIERESYKVIDLTESDSNGEPWQKAEQWPNEEQWPIEESNQTA
uniref:Uncharacterized protein n=1 Tax=Tetranychus urticae TaxID=32264 RepID=T1KCF2_TETUR